MKADRILLVFLIAAAASTLAANDKAAYVGAITCFSDSPQGTEMAEDAARFLSSRRQDKFYSKSFVVTDREDKDSNRFLILILSDEGKQEFAASRQTFEDALLALLQRMKQKFGDDKDSVILQDPDKSNILEACFDDKGAGMIKKIVDAPAPRPTSAPPLPSPAPTPKI